MKLLKEKTISPLAGSTRRDIENTRYIETAPTGAMTHGSEIHQKLEDIFKQDATPTTFEKAVKTSKSEAVMSRECFVISPNYGIKGYIDEIWMKPDEIVIIYDKPGRTPYQPTMNQVRAYCLAFKNMTNDSRTIKSALKKRGTKNLFWIEVFTPEIEKEIAFTIYDPSRKFSFWNHSIFSHGCITYKDSSHCFWTGCFWILHNA